MVTQNLVTEERIQKSESRTMVAAKRPSFFWILNSKLLTSSFEYLTGTENTESSANVCAVNFMVKPNGQLVTVSSTCCHAYTSVLSNRSSSCALHSLRLGDLILGKVGGGHREGIGLCASGCP